MVEQHTYDLPPQRFPSRTALRKLPLALPCSRLFGRLGAVQAQEHQRATDARPCFFCKGASRDDHALGLQVEASAQHGGFLLRGDRVVVVGVWVENAGLAIFLADGSQALDQRTQPSKSISFGGEHHSAATPS